MISESTKTVIDRAKRIYSVHRELWETEHRNRFVAIEPESGDYFFADSFDAAVRAARTKYPARLSHTLRIGHDAAFHIGLMES
jgi:uncharacterized HAD superfamily protein